MFQIIFGLALLLLVGAAYSIAAFWLTGWKKRLPAAAALLALGIWSRTALVALLYLAAALALSRLIKWKPLKSGIPQLALVALFLLWGWGNMGRAEATHYTVTSPKLDRDYRVVFLSDLHYGTVQDPEVLKAAIPAINGLGADLVIFGGDLLDEGTDRGEMEACFALLGQLESKLGRYYIYGNHDRQRYSDAPAYSEEELAAAIGKNGITILREQAVALGQDLLLVGREDLGSRGDRTLSGVQDDARFILTADHQANDAASDAALGTDLLLAGHTHGGQIWPAAYFEFLYQGYCYGFYEGDMDVIVSSGFAGWGLPVRTQHPCEYVVVDLKAQ